MFRVACEVAVGAIDGVNREFSVSSNYAPNTPVVFLNGLTLRRDWADGWEELGANRIRLRIPPLPGDAIQVYFQFM